MVDMQRRFQIFFPVAIAVVSFSGCGAIVPNRVTNPSEITLPYAMEQVSCAIKAHQNANSRFGVNPANMLDEIEVILDLKASDTGDNKLVVDTSLQPFGVFSAFGVSYTDHLQTVRERGNTIKLKYKNIYTASLNKPGEVRIGRDGPPLNPFVSERSPVLQPCEGGRPSFDRQLYEANIRRK